MDNMLGKFVELVNWFDDLTNGVCGNVLGPVKDLVPKLSDPEDRLRFRREFAKFLRKEPCWTDAQVPQVAEPKPAVYTRCISGEDVIIIDATDGSVTIPGSTEIFKGGIYNDSGVTLGVQGQARGPVRVSVYEQTVDGNFVQIFGSLGRRFFTEHQVVWFVEKHTKWLRVDGHATFLPFMIGNEELIAHVGFDDYRQLRVGVNRFSHSGVWRAERCRRVVIPQLEPLTPSVS